MNELQRKGDAIVSGTTPHGGKHMTLPRALTPPARPRGVSAVAMRSLTLATLEALDTIGHVTPPTNAAEIAHHRAHFAGIPGVR